MREIKFQYMLIKENKVIDTQILTLDEIEQEIDFHYELLSNDEKVKKRQYTGLKDKNGIEIYEGDILKCFGVIAKVVWDNSDALYRYIYNSSGERYMEILGTHSYEHFEVIGNIYENLDLVGE